MEKNVGGIDKIIRFILGIAAVGVGLLAPIAGGLRIAALVVAAVAFATASLGF